MNKIEQSAQKTQENFETILTETPNRCVIVMDKALNGGHLANAIAVIALTVGQRHPMLVGEPLVDASGFTHPGLIPVGIPMLCTSQAELVKIRQEAIDNGCDIVDFPIQGQQTKSYAEFINMTAQIKPEDMKYTGIALIGQKKPISKIVKDLELLK
jgi:hypothetical protein